MPKIKNIKYIGEIEQQCILVDAKDHLYITNDHIITHNTIISAAISEISWFFEDGWTDEKIMLLYSKLKQRVSSRLHGNYYGRTILDSSPNSLENQIDKFIWQEAPESKLNYIFSGARWKWVKQDYPNFYDEQGNEIHSFNKSFPIFKGGNGKIPQVITKEEELELYDPIDLMWVPRFNIYNENLLDQALEDTLEFMRDFGGVPAGMQERIFPDQAVIDRIFENNLKNLDIIINADSMAEPEHLIWNQIKDVLFYRIVDKYYFNYCPELPRAIGVDQSYAEDVCSISMSHVERDPTRRDDMGNDLTVYVTDFTVNIHAGTGQINLDAIRFFILDLINVGHLSILAVGFDNFQSIPTRQALKRFGINVDYVSMDKTNQPYLTFIDYIFKRRYFCGYNTFLKNNLRSLQMVKRDSKKGTYKVDHLIGEVCTTNGNPNAGLRSKDSSDSAGMSVYLLTLYPERFIPYQVWNPNFVDRSYDTVKISVIDNLAKLGLAI